MDPVEQREISRKGGRASHGGDGEEGGNGRRGRGREEEYSEEFEGSEGRGFAAMDPEEQREIARKGGQASHGGGRRGT